MGKYVPAMVLALVLCLAISCQGQKQDQTQQQGSELTDADRTTSDQNPSTKAVSRPKVSLELETFNGGFFSIEKPKGWQVIPAGACATFAFLIRDPSQPLRQIFFFGEVGPIYLSQQQKQIDHQYVSMGGYPSSWLDMPVVNPLTPENFLAQFHLIAQTNIARQFMPQCPRLENFQVVAAVPQPCPIPGGQGALIRALFTRENRLGEGLFLANVAPLLPTTGGPGGGIGQGFHVIGISAPKDEFAQVESVLLRSVSSFNISQSYVNDCLRQQQTAYEGLLKAGKTLSESSDLIMQGWENRNRTEDILSEKTSDAILGRERLYDPETGAVYEFENGFYDTYRTRQNEYEMDNLQPLPNDSYNLWTTPPLDGPAHLR
jgi:hypothetical protein